MKVRENSLALRPVADGMCSHVARLTSGQPCPTGNAGRAPTRNASPRYWPVAEAQRRHRRGPSRLVVLDLDCHGKLPEDWRLPGVIDGKDVFAQICEWAGQPGRRPTR